VKLIPGTVLDWSGPYDMDTLILMQNVEHSDCIYFLSHSNFAELQLRREFARATEDALQWLYEQKRNLFPFMEQSFELLSKLARK